MKNLLILGLLLMGSISAFAQQAVEILHPTGVEERKFGETIDIEWLNTGAGTSDYFQLFYSNDGASFQNFFNGYIYQLSNNGDTSTYTWTLPDLGADSSSSIRVRVFNQTLGAADTSAGFRLYYEPEVAIAFPTDTVERKFGETVDVTWVNGDIGTADYFSLYYSNDGGTFQNFFNGYIYQLTNNGDTSSYTWTLPDLGADSSSSIRVRVFNQTRSVADTSEGFRLYYEPEVNIVFPTDTVERKFGETVDVSWVNGDIGTADYFSLYYSNDGASFQNFFNGYIYQLTNNGDTSSYTWTLPDLGADSSSSIRIRVFNQTRTVADTSEGFRLYYEPEVAMVFPTDTVERKFGETVDVTWVNGDIGSADYFSLYYSNDGASFQNFFNGYIYQLTNNGDTSSYTWTLPDLGADSSSSIRVRVFNQTRTVADTSEGFRLYYEPEVNILSPASGQYVAQSASQLVTWDNGDVGTADYFRLFYAVDGGNFTNIFNGYIYQFTAEGSKLTYNWSVPAIESTDVKFRIFNQTRSVSDTTKSFTICATCPGIALYHPNGGEQFSYGEEVEIGWSLGDVWEPTDSIQVELSLDAGSTFETESIFAGSYSAIVDNKVNWTIPETANDQLLIRVQNVSQGTSDVSDNVFEIVAPAVAVTLSAPNGGESFTVGQSTNITWTSAGIPDTDLIEIRLSTDGGSTYSILADGTFGTYGGTYSWTVPNQVTSTARLQIVNTTQDVSDASDANFSIVSGTSLTLAAPNGGESFTVGENTNITWTSAGIPDTDLIEIRLSTDGGTTYSLLADGTFGTYGGTYSWTVSDQVTSTARIEVASTTQNVADASDANFSIVSGTSLTLSAPNGGESFTVGESTNITWTSAGIPDTDLIEIRLSTDGGATYSLLADGTFGTYGGTYSWTVPNQLTSTARLQIVNTTQDVSDASDANFSIVSGTTLSLTAPNGGESFTVGESTNITWTSAGIPDTDLIEIRLSMDGGTTYSILADGTFGTYGGTYSWTVPDQVTSTARIEISNTTQNVADASDANFSIEAAPAVNVTSPNGGEVWNIGESYQISWEPSGFLSSDVLEIALSRDGGLSYEVISTGPNTNYAGNQITWEVEGAASTEALVKVTNTTQGISDSSANVFTLQQVERTVTLTSPTGGDQWEAGSTQQIAWDRLNIPDSDGLSFQISYDGGTNFEAIGSTATFGNYPNNSATYTVPDQVSNAVLLAVVNTTRAIGDTSALISIIPEPDRTPAVFTSFSSPSVVGVDYEMAVVLNEPATISLVALSAGSAQPDATAIRAAAEGSTPLEGQVAIAQYAYESGEMELAGSGEFIRQANYDFYLTAEDTAGNLTSRVGYTGILAHYTPLEQDSLVVKTLYEQMGGENWTVAENWISLPLTEREELTVSEERITEIRLAEKGLEGALPVDILTMDALSVLDLSSNEVSELPTLTGLQLTTLAVGENLLDFSDLEKNASLFGESSEYSPQAAIVASDSIALKVGASYIFTLPVGGENTSYTWYVDSLKTHEKTFQVIEGQSSESLMITDLNYDRMGIYRGEATNAALPGLTLVHDPIQLWATANLEFAVTADGDPLASGAAYALRNRGPGLTYDSIPKLASGSGDPAGLPVVDGKVTFENLLLGEYLIAVRGDKDKYLPTYYENTYLWEEASLLLFTADASENMEMFVIPPPLTPDDGSGTVAGTIESDFGDEASDGRIAARRKVKRAGCSMRRFVRRGRTDQEDGEYELIAYVESDDEGRFKFDFIPPGRYRFNIEYPGIPMDPDSFVEFEIGEDGTANNSIELQATVTEDGIKVDRINALAIRSGRSLEVSIYPNPAKDKLNLSSQELHGISIVELFDLSGTRLVAKPLDLSVAQTLHVDALAEGIYLIKISNAALQQPARYKLIVRKR